MIDVAATIVAVATPPAGAIRGIVRMSGSQSIDILASLMRIDVAASLRDASLSITLGSASRRDATTLLRSSVPRLIPGSLSTGGRIGEVPCDVYLWPSSRSYTRQPSAEIHTLGSPPVLDAVIAALCRAGARLASPGEFTMRAFLAGRLDLTQAEAVLGVIDARSQSELNVALAQLAGGLAKPLHHLRETLLDLLAHLEAGLDFVEEDIEFISPDELQTQLQYALTSVAELLEQIGKRTESAGEPRVVLRGLPNVGKSSLFNALVGSDRSIVSNVAATTRDFLCNRIQLAGQTVLLFDTAGVESDFGSDGISAAAQRLAAEQLDQAALQLFCIDATRPLSSWEHRELAKAPVTPRIVVLTKCDQPFKSDFTGPSIATSSQSGVGLESLRKAIATKLNEVLNDDSAVIPSTAGRCVESLRRAAESLRRAVELVRHRGGEELVAAEVRVSLNELGAVAGVVYTDDILDRVFGRFCIGK